MATQSMSAPSAWVKRCARRLRALQPRLAAQSAEAFANAMWQNADQLEPEMAAEIVAPFLPAVPPDVRAAP